MKKVYLVFLIALSSLYFSGCATKAHFSNSPVNDSEFKKSMIYLESEYSDIKEYDRFFATPSEAPTVQELEELWGKPRIETRWGLHATNIALGAGLMATGIFSYPFFVLLIALYPVPPQIYTWEKGNYEITAVGRNDLLVGYDKRIHSWEWDEIPKNNKISNTSVEPIKNTRAAF